MPGCDDSAEFFYLTGITDVTNVRNQGVQIAFTIQVGGIDRVGSVG